MDECSTLQNLQNRSARRKLHEFWRACSAESDRASRVCLAIFGQSYCGSSGLTGFYQWQQIKLSVCVSIAQPIPASVFKVREIWCLSFQLALKLSSVVSRGVIFHSSQFAGWASLSCLLLCRDLLRCVVLSCALLCCNGLICALLFCDLLCYSVLCWAFTVLCWALLYCALLCCAVLCFALLSCAVPCYTLLSYTVLCCA